jgi:predicted  nucleic acid-binding Zn-ribbon protein
LILAVSEMVQATKASGGGAAAWADAGSAARVNEAVRAAAEEIGANAEARSAVVQMGRLQQAASRDERRRLRCALRCAAR